ncbi:MAG: class I SAM-dependent methyltransferase, partial [Planctomycetota bacterium]
LELGCAAGGNLVPIAARFPNCRCVGIDASNNQIREGISFIDSLGLNNVELRHQDIGDFSWTDAPFDYIICHGVYSWVPEATQRSILSICQNHLAENGIALISYNTYPGWYLRRGVREMMGFHASGFHETQTKIDQSRALVDFLAGAVRTDGDAYDQLLREELSILRSSEDSYVYHEHLEKDNEPLFFYQFIERAEEAQLRYLGDAQFSTMVPSEFSASTQETLQSIAPGIVPMEQYLDFLRNRKFRQTLLCREAVQPSRTIQPNRLSELFVSTPLTVSEDTEASGSNEATFEHPSGQSISVADNQTANALRRLVEQWPNSLRVSAIIEQFEEEGIGQSILELYAQGLVSLSSTSVACQTQPSACPKVRDLVRRQAEHGDFVTNERHERIPLDSFLAAIVTELDGERDLDAIVERISARASAPDGGPLQTEDLRAAISAALNQLAQAALLVD